MSGRDTNPDAENPIPGHLCLFMAARTWFPLLPLDVFYFRKLPVLPRRCVEIDTKFHVIGMSRHVGTQGRAVYFLYRGVLKESLTQKSLGQFNK